MTNYERIKQMSVEEMAKILYKSDDFMEKMCHDVFDTQKRCCVEGKEITSKQRKNCVKKWLESEVKE